MNFLKQMWKKKKLGFFCMLILIVLVIVAIFADQIAPYKMVNGSLPVSIADANLAPYFMLSAEERAEQKASAAASGEAIHWLGTDTVGTDLLSYLIYGARTSVILCIVCTALSTLISVVIGVLSAVIGGWFDLIVQRIVDAWQCIPSMLIIMLMMSIMGSGMWQLIIALSVPSGIGGSRMIRSSAISVKDSGYCSESDLLGGTIAWKSIKHVVPNILPLIIITAAGSLGGVVMMEASMDFLGYGVDVGTPSWGYIITGQGKENMIGAPWLTVIPGLCIMLMVFAANMFGDAVRDILDPRLKGGVGSFTGDQKKLRVLATKLSAEAEENRKKEEQKAKKTA